MSQNGMSEASPPRGRGPTAKELAYWTVGTLLVLGLAWFATRIVIPFVQTRAVVTELTFSSSEELRRDVIKRLGEPEKAIPKLRLYLRAPGGIAPHKVCAFEALACYGRQAVPLLVEALTYRDEDLRLGALYALAEIGPEAEGAVPALIKVCGSSGEDREWIAAVRALGRVGPAARDALPMLEKMERDEDLDRGKFSAWKCREGIQKAIANIRGAEPELSSDKKGPQ